MVRLPSRQNSLAALAFLIPVIAVFSSKAMVPVLILMGLIMLWSHGPRHLNFSIFPRGPAIGLGFLILWAALSALWSAQPEVVLRGIGPVALLIFGGLFGVGLAGRLGPTYRRPIFIGLIAGLFVAFCLISFEAATLSWMTRQFKQLSWANIINFETGGMNLGAFLKDAVVILSLLAWPVAAAFSGRRKYFWWVVLFALLCLTAFWFQAMTALLAILGGAVLTGCGFLSFRWTARLLALGVLLVSLGMPWLIRPVVSVESLQLAGQGDGPLPLPSSAISRLYTWKFVGEKIEERAVIGWGYKASRYVPGGNEKYTVYGTSESGQRKLLYRDYKIPLHPYNQALQVWLELGLIGALIAGLAGFGMIWRLSRPEGGAASRRSPFVFGLIASILAYDLLSFGAWQNWWIASQFLSFMLLASIARTDEIASD